MPCNNNFCKNDKFNPFITFLSKAQRSKLLMRRVLLLLALASVLVLAGGETNGICVSWHVSPLMALIASCLRHCPSKWGRQLTHISQSRSALLGGTKHFPRRSPLEESPNMRNTSTKTTKTNTKTNTNTNTVKTHFSVTIGVLGRDWTVWTPQRSFKTHKIDITMANLKKNKRYSLFLYFVFFCIFIFIPFVFFVYFTFCLFCLFYFLSFLSILLFCLFYFLSFFVFLLLFKSFFLSL